MDRRTGVSNKDSRLFPGYVVLASAFLVSAALYGAAFSFGVFIEPMRTELGWGSAWLSGAFSLALLVSGSLGILAGRLSDRFGPRSIVLACNVSLGLGYVLMSRIDSLWQLYLSFGLLIGMGMSAGIAPLQSTVVRWFVRRRGLMVSIFLMGASTSEMIVPPLANRLIQSHGWRTAFLLLGTVSFLIVFVSSLFLKSDPTQMGKHPDGPDRLNTDVSLLPEGLTFREAFRTGEFWLLCVFFFCFFLTSMIALVHLVPHAINVGISPHKSALLLAVVHLMATGARIPEGFVADRIGVWKTALIVTFLLVASFLWLSFTGDSIGPLVGFAVVFGLTIASMDLLLSLFASELFGLVAVGAIIGFLNFILELGGATGPVISGYLFDSTGSYHPAFLLCTIVSDVAFGILVFLRKTQPRVPQHSGN